MKRFALALLALFLVAPPSFAAFPSVVANDTSATTSASTSHVVDLPGGTVAAGQYIEVFVAFPSQGAFTVTWPSGWVSHGLGNCQSNACWLATGRRIVDGTEGSTITVTTSSTTRSTHQSYRFAGNFGAQTTFTSENVAVSAAFNPSAVSPSGGARDYLWLVFGVGNDVDCAGATAPTNYSNISVSTDNGTSLFIARRTLNTATEDPGNFGGSPGSCVGGGMMGVLVIWPGIAGAPYGAFGTNNTEAAAATNHTVGLPTAAANGMLAGDFWLSTISCSGTPTITYPAGWTHLKTLDDGAGTSRVASYWRTTDGLDGATMSVTTSSSQTCAIPVQSFRNAADPAIRPPEASAGVQASSGTSIDPDSITPTGGSKDYFVQAVGVLEVANTLSAGPTGYSTFLVNTTGAGNTTSRFGSLRQETASSIDPGASTVDTTTAFAVYTVAVHPVEAAAAARRIRDSAGAWSSGR